MSGVTQAAAWRDLYLRHALQGSLLTQPTRDLYQLVLFRAAQQPFLPVRTDVPRDLDLERQSAESLAVLVAQFCAGLVRVACDAVDAPPSPNVDARLPTVWNRELIAYAERLHWRTVKNWMDTGAPAVGAERISERMHAFGQVVFDLLGGLTQLSATAEQHFLRAVLASFDAPASNQPVIEMKAPSGAAAEADLSLENRAAARAHLQCRVGPLRRADGIDAAFEADLLVQPSQFTLEPGQELDVHLSINLHRQSYQPNVLYVGAMSVLREGDAPLQIPLRITATAPVLRAT